VVAVALCARLFPFYAIPAAAILAVALSWVFTQKPLGDLGFRWPEKPVRLLLMALLIAVAMNSFVRTLIRPLIEGAFGARDLRYLGPVRGNFDVFLGLMPIVWFSAALCEEVVHRGFIQQRLERLFGRSTLGSAIAVLTTSTVFALSHGVQGTSGIIETGLVSVAMGIIFIRSGHNLLLLILIHGFWNTFSLSIMYLGLPW
jgi:membrane protease YdiL (CAAX protease family)